MLSVGSKIEIGEWRSHYYDISLNLLPVGHYPRFIREVVENMDIKPGQSIIDLGSGTGMNDCFMARKIGPHGRIVGLDISDEMLVKTWELCLSYSNVIFEKRRVELPMPYKEESDKVFISFVLHRFEDDMKAVITRTAYQTLKPRGNFHILDYAEFDIHTMWFPFRWAFARWE